MSHSAVHKRVSYLSQISAILAKDDDINSTRLTSYYGFVERDICLKHQVRTMATSDFKARRCKKCFAYLKSPVTCRVKVNGKKLKLTCRQCSHTKQIPMASPRKTYHEQLLFSQFDKHTPMSHDQSHPISSRETDEEGAPVASVTPLTTTSMTAPNETHQVQPAFTSLESWDHHRKLHTLVRNCSKFD